MLLIELLQQGTSLIVTCHFNLIPNMQCLFLTFPAQDAIFLKRLVLMQLFKRRFGSNQLILFHGSRIRQLHLAQLLDDFIGLRLGLVNQRVGLVLSLLQLGIAFRCELLVGCR